MHHPWDRRLVRRCSAPVLALSLLFPSVGQAASETSTATAAEASLLAAHGFVERGRWQFAVEEYQRFIKQYPKHKEVLDAQYGLAVALVRSKRLQESLGVLHTVLADKEKRHRLDALLLQAHAQAGLQHYDAAFASYQRIRKDFHKDPAALQASVQAAQLSLQLQRYDQARDYAQAAMRQDPHHQLIPTARYLLALTEQAAGRPAQAVAAIDAFFAAHDKHVLAYDAALLRCRCQEAMPAGPDAQQAIIQSYRRLLDVAPEGRRDEARQELALAMARAGEHQQVVDFLARCLPSATPAYQAVMRLQYGISAVQLGRLDEARQAFMQLRKVDAHYGRQARYWLAQCDMQAGQWDQAVKHLHELRRQSKAGDQNPSMLQIAADEARCLSSIGKHQQAAELLHSLIQKADAADPLLTTARLAAARAWHACHKYDAAEQIIKQIAKNDVAHADAVLLLAAGKAARNDHQAASALVEQLSRRAGPKQMQALLFQAHCAVQLGDWDRARKHVDGISDKADPVIRAQALALRARVLQAAAKADAAAQAYAQALALVQDQRMTIQPELTAHWQRQQAVCLHQAGSHQQSAALFQTIIKQNGDPEASLLAAECALQQQDWARVERLLAKTHRAKDPVIAARAWTALAWARRGAGHHKAAAEAFARARQAAPDSSYGQQAAIESVVSWQQAGDANKALHACGQAGKHLRSSAQKNSLGIIKARCLLAVGKEKDALRQAGSLQGHKDLQARHLYDLAWVYRHANRGDEAGQCYRRLIQAYPDDPLSATAAVEWAEQLFSAEDMAGSRRVAQALLQQADKPTVTPALQAEARLRLAWCDFREQKFSEAAGGFAKAAAELGDQEAGARAAYQAGLSAFRAGKHKQATEFLQRVHKAQTDAALRRRAALLLGQIANDAGDHQHARELFTRFITQSEVDDASLPHAWFGLARAQHQLGDRQQARQSYREVISRDRGELAAQAQFQLGETLFVDQDYAQAVKELLKVDLVYDFPRWSARALVEVGRIHHKQGQFETAEARYQEVLKRFADSDAAALAKQSLSQLTKSRRTK